MNSEQTPWHEVFQDAVAASMLRSQKLAQAFSSKFQPAFLTDPSTSHLMAMAMEHQKVYGKTPSREVLYELIRKSYPDQTDKHLEERRSLESKLVKLCELEVEPDEPFIVKQISQFLSWRAVLNEIKAAVEVIQKGEVDIGIVDRMAKAVRMGEVKVERGITKDDIAAVLRKEVNPDFRPRVPTGIVHLDNEIGGGLRGGELGVLLAPPKGFKCSRPETPTMMFDGSVKAAREVKLGDLLMGDDSQPRRVLEVGKGRGEMYRVEQSNGDAYTVTAEHILCLKRPSAGRSRAAPTTGYGLKRYHSGEFLEMTAVEYAGRSKNFKKTWNGYKVGVEFSAHDVPIDPYYVGLWLGDGLSRGTGICVADGDTETFSYLRGLAIRWGLGIKEEYKTRTTKTGKRVRAKYTILHLSAGVGSVRNPLSAALKALGLGKANHKHVPELYRLNSRQTRLQVLAGMLDSDGHFNRVKGFVFSNTNKRLCDDACWLARSLGFRAHVIPYRSTCCKSDGSKAYKMAYRTLIQGKISEIPTRLPRKRARDSTRVTDRAALKVTSVGESDWCGWTTDGNHRYLLSDFTVTHNSGCLMNFAVGGMQRGVDKKVLYVTLELSEALQGLRFAIRTTMAEKDQLFKDPERYIRSYEERCEVIYGDNADIDIKYFAPYTCTPKTLRAYLDMMKLDHGIEYGLILIDYLDLMGADDKKDKDYLEKVQICTDIRAIAVDYDVPIWTACRATREATGKKRINMSHMAGAFERVAIADLVAALCQTDRERTQGIMRIAFVACRNESGNRQVICEFQPAKMSICSVESRELTDDDFEDDDSGGGGGYKKRKKGGDDDDNADDEAKQRGLKKLKALADNRQKKASITATLLEEDD